MVVAPQSVAAQNKSAFTHEKTAQESQFSNYVKSLQSNQMNNS